jgi:hemoglobin
MKLRSFTCFAFVICLAACASTRQGSLYQALGEEAGMRRLINEVVRELHSDRRINALFANTDDAYFKERLYEQFCLLSGGGCEYTGLDMEEAHSGMGLTATDFNYFVEDTRIGMTRAGISIGAQNRLLALLQPMHGDVLNK